MPEGRGRRLERMSIALKNDINLWRPGGKAWRAEITITKPTKSEVIEQIDKIKEILKREIPDET